MPRVYTRPDADTDYTSWRSARDPRPSVPTSTAPLHRYVALQGLDGYFLEDGEDLAALLSELEQVGADHDVVVWEGKHLAAVIVRGKPTVFTAPEPLTSKVSDGFLARLGKAEEPEPASNGDPAPERPIRDPEHPWRDHKRATQPRVKILDYPVCTVLAWLGANGYDNTQAQRVLKVFGVWRPAGTVTSMLYKGRRGIVSVPELPAEVALALRKAALGK